MPDPAITAKTVETVTVASWSFFVGQAKGEQGALKNRSKTAKTVIKATPLNSTPLFRHAGRWDPQLVEHSHAHSPAA